MTTQPFSSCCKAPVTFTKVDIYSDCICSACGKPCTVTPPVNASAVEGEIENMKDWIETSLDAAAHGKWFRAPNFEIIQDVAEILAPQIVRHTSTLSDSTLREVLAEVEEDEPPYKDYKFRGSTSHGKNQERQRIRAIINKRLEK